MAKNKETLDRLSNFEILNFAKVIKNEENSENFANLKKLGLEEAYNLLSEKVFPYFKDRFIFVAGGFFESFFRSKTFRDIDIYGNLYSLSDTGISSELLENGFKRQKRPKSQEQRCEAYSKDGLNVELIDNYNKAPIDVLSDFDFTVCCFGIDNYGSVYLHKSFVDDFSTKSLKYNHFTDCPNKIERLMKYIYKGYNPTSKRKEVSQAKYIINGGIKADAEKQKISPEDFDKFTEYYANLKAGQNGQSGENVQNNNPVIEANNEFFDEYYVDHPRAETMDTIHPYTAGIVNPPVGVVTAIQDNGQIEVPIATVDYLISREFGRDTLDEQTRREILVGNDRLIQPPREEEIIEWYRPTINLHANNDEIANRLRDILERTNRRNEQTGQNGQNDH